jgi:dolichol-phosphate mannosyltransferase
MSILQSELKTALTGLDYEIIFVDDGSVDCTVERIVTAPNIRVIRLKIPGKARRFMRASRAARGRIAVLIDGDLQNDPTDIPRLRLKSRAVPILSVVTARNAKTLC